MHTLLDDESRSKTSEQLFRGSMKVREGLVEGLGRTYPAKNRS